MNKATAYLHPKFTVSEIDPRLYGSFIEQLGQAVYHGIYDPGMPMSDSNGFREDTASLVKELNVPVVRYPGGNFVSGYHWEDGIGPKENRPKRLELAWGVTETNQFGLNEFTDWAKKVNTDVMMAVNLGTRGVEDAKNIVEYCNHPGGTYWSDLRVAHGYPQPHNIKLWCLGNEMDGGWQIGSKTATEYARLAHETAKMMKWVDPSIELVVCGSSGYGMPTFGDWERTVLEECYDSVDYISLHTYYGDPNRDTKDYLANSKAFGEFIESVAAICDAVKAKKHSKKNIYLSFDEWNTWNRDSNPPVERWSIAPHQIENVYNLEDALVVGTMLISLINHSDRVKIACLAQLVNVIAPIMTSETGAWRQTIFFPYQQASTLGRGTALQVKLEVPTYTTERLGEIPLVDCAAVQSADGQTLTFFLVNKDLENQTAFECDLSAFGNYEIQMQSELTGDDLFAVNTEAHPDTVLPQELHTATVENGVLKAPLAPHSWNTVVLRKI